MRESSMIPSSRDDEISKFSVELKQIDEEEVQRRCSDAVGDPRIFSMIAKISLGLQKFCNHSENFAILAKLRIFAS